MAALGGCPTNGIGDRGSHDASSTEAVVGWAEESPKPGSHGQHSYELLDFRLSPRLGARALRALYQMPQMLLPDPSVRS